jgi:hypothetical protein
VKYRFMKYMMANMAAPVAKLMPETTPMSRCMSTCHGIMAFCLGKTLARSLPGTMAHSYTTHATANTPPTTKDASTAAESQAYTPPAHVNANTNNPNPHRNNNCPPTSIVASRVRNLPVFVPTSLFPLYGSLPPAP